MIATVKKNCLFQKSFKASLIKDLIICYYHYTMTFYTAKFLGWINNLQNNMRIISFLSGLFIYFLKFQSRIIICNHF